MIPTEKTCPCCGEVFKKPDGVSKIAFRHRRFCSTFCYQKAYRLRYKEKFGLWPCQASRAAPRPAKPEDDDIDPLAYWDRAENSESPT